MELPFTLFNTITLALIALTLASMFYRWKSAGRRSWSLLYYLVLLLYWLAFDGALNRWFVLGGFACAAVASCEYFGRKIWRAASVLESVALVYVILRSVDLLARGELFYYLSTGRPAST